LHVSFLLSIVELRLSTLNKPISDLINTVLQDHSHAGTAQYRSWITMTYVALYFWCLSKLLGQPLALQECTMGPSDGLRAGHRLYCRYPPRR